MKLSGLVLLAPFSVVGCGGGGGGHAVPVPLPQVTSSPQKSTAGSGNVSFTFAIPRGKRGSTHARRPSFVSPGAVSVGVTINGTQTTAHDLGQNLPGCVPNGSTEIDCTVSAQAPNGSDSFDVKLYDASGATGHMLSEGTATAFIDGSPQQIPITMNPYVASIQLALPQPPAADCGVGQLDTSRPLPLTVSAFDASGALITPPGTFQNPITLANSDSSGAATLSQTTLPDATAAPTLTYSGIDYTVPVTISAAANGVAAAQITSATLNLGADRPLINNSRSIYAVTSPTLSGASEQWTVTRSATYPATPYPNVLTIGASPANLCQIHIVNPPIADATRDSGDGSLGGLYYVEPNRMQGDDIYVTTQANGTSTNTLLWLSESSSWQHNDPPGGAVTNYLPVITAFNTPLIVGALPHPSSQVYPPSFDYVNGSSNLFSPDIGVWTTQDRVWKSHVTPDGQDGIQEFIAVPSGSALSPYAQPLHSTIPSTTVTDLGVETIPAACAVGPTIPTQAVHLTYTNTGSATAHTEEWVRRDVGVVCRRQNRAFGNIAALQSYQPVPIR